jgi:four helix bundle protein
MEDEKMTSFFRFEDLRVYDKVLNYVEWVHGTVRFFPDQGPVSDMGQRFMKAAVDIAVAIAEGSGRNKVQFVVLLKNARAAARECLVLGTTSSRLNFISAEQNEENREMLIEISKMLGALITSLEKPGRRHEYRNGYEEQNPEDDQTN